MQATSSSAQDPLKDHRTALNWIYLESSELSCLKGDGTAHALCIAQLVVSSQAKAREFAAAELNSSEPPYFFTLSTQARHRSTRSSNL